MSGLRPVVLSGPSGAGKSTLLKMLTERFPDSFAFSVSYTSRKPRAGEVNGRDYRFVSAEEMMKGIEEGRFLEHAEFAGNMYGTPREAVEASPPPSGFLTRLVGSSNPQLLSLVTEMKKSLISYLSNWNTGYHIVRSGRVCILDVDANGVRSIYGANPPLNARFVFIAPPSLESLEDRLRKRGTESEEKIQSRLRQARIDMEFAESRQGKQIYDACIVNNDVDRAYLELFEFLRDQIELTQRSRGDESMVASS